MEFNKYNRRYQNATSISNDSFQTVDGGAEVSAGSGNETDYTLFLNLAE
jgi:hypothetical protein